MRWSESQVIAELTPLTRRRLRLWVRQGWIIPARSSGSGGPYFDERDVARLRLVCQLKDEMNLNDDALPVVLSLLDQLYGVRRELRALTQAVERQPDPVRSQVRHACRMLLEE